MDIFTRTDGKQYHYVKRYNGTLFGSGTIVVKGATREEVAAELDKRIERSRKLAVKKFGA